MKNDGQNPIALYDFTIPIDAYTVAELQTILRTQAKRWVFQTEKGKETGYKHYQVRLSLKKKMRWSTMKKTPIMKGRHSPTSNPTYYAGDFFYVMKDDTRIDGPWKDTDDIKVMTTQLEWFMKQPLRTFQKSIIAESKKFDMRKINLIWDTTGCCGKSLLSELMEYNGLAEEIPPFRLMDDIFQWVASRPKKSAYIVDMPRGMKKDKLGDFYSGIEVIKNGVAYDKRNSAKKYRFNRPRVFIFTNTLPCFDLMSKDRWEVWKIVKTQKNDAFDVLKNEYDFIYKIIK